MFEYVCVVVCVKIVMIIEYGWLFEMKGELMKVGDCVWL